MDRKLHKLVAASLATLALAGAPLSSQAGSGSDYAFDQLMGTMAARDTGSTWFDGYVEMVNQHVAYLNNSEPYGAAGPSGPIDGFNSYVAGFRETDSGSRLFNNYVDAVNRVIRQKQEY
jgi:hypothetical protein